MIHFSIIIPAMNAAGTLAAALDSIAAQSINNYEILLRDGGSIDATLDVAAKFQPRFGTRLRIVQKPDQGIYDAMNQGIDDAHGRWIYFLGADDKLHDGDVLERVTMEIRRRPHCQLVYGDVIFTGNNNRYDGEFNLAKLVTKNICHQAIFYRRDVFRLLGKYDLVHPALADWDFNMRCFSSELLDIHHLDLLIADFNNLTGFSSRKQDSGILKKRTALWRFQPSATVREKSLFALLQRKFENVIDRL